MGNSGAKVLPKEEASEKTTQYNTYYDKFIIDNIKFKKSRNSVQINDESKSPSNAYGVIPFKHCKPNAKFIRASISQPEYLYTILTKYWDIKKPKLIISFENEETSNKNYSSFNENLKIKIKNDIFELCKENAIWILTNGYECGISKLIGELINSFHEEHHCTVIGIGKWKAVRNRHLLKKKHRSYEIKNLSKDEKKKRKETSQNGKSSQITPDSIEYYLDSNHDAFILCDDNENHTTFAKVIGEQVKCPVVVLNNFPENSNKTNKEDNSTDLDQIIVELALQDLEKATDSKENLEKATDSKEIEKRKIKFAIQFNRIKVVEELLKEKDSTDQEMYDEESKIKPDMKLTSSEDQEDFRIKFLKLALRKNKHEIVRFFIESGLQIKKLYSLDTLIDLYLHKKKKYSALFSEKKKKKDSKRQTEIKNRKYIPHDLNYADKYLVYKCKMSTKDLENYQYISQLINLFANGLIPNQYDEKKNNCPEFFHWHLCIWAILTNKHEIARLFWENGKYRIGIALVASHVYSKLEMKCLQEGDLKWYKNYCKGKKYFENASIKGFQELCMKNEILAKYVLTQSIPFFGRNSCMTIACKLQILNFFDNRIFNLVLDEYWYGEMNVEINICRIIANLPLSVLTTKLLIFPVHKEKNLNQNDIENGNDNCCSCEKSELCKFYTAPVTKFLIYVMSYIAFLGCFSYLCLTELSSSPTSRIFEYIVYTYFGGLFVEKIRKFSKIINTKDQLFKSLIVRNRILFVLFDSALLILFWCTIILRNLPASLNIPFTVVQSLFSLILSWYCLKLLEFYRANKFLGSLILLITKLISKTWILIALYMIAIYAYGVLNQALLFGNSTLDATLISNIFYQPYWQIYGTINYDFINGNIQNNNGISATPHWLVPVVCAFYMIFTNIIFLNILIANFNNLYNEYEKTKNIEWAPKFMTLIEEFYNRPFLPPPLNIIEILFLILVGDNRHRIYTSKPSSNKTGEDPDDAVNECYSTLNNQDFETDSLKSKIHQKANVDLSRLLDTIDDMINDAK